MRKIVFIIVFTLVSIQGITQTLDTLLVTGGITGDSMYLITENRLEKNKFFGNSWYTGLAYNRSKENEFSASFGRSYVKVFTSGGGTHISLKSWGFNYSNILKKEKNYHTTGAFTEWSAFPIPPATARIEYFYDITSKSHYMRPAVGISFLHLDILYNYSFMLHGETNQYKHGLTLRAKHIFPYKKWQKSYPVRC